VKLHALEPIAFPLAAGAIRLLAATWRLRVQHEEHLAAARAAGRPLLFALWHSRILPLLFHHRGEGIVTLISRHRDGGHLARLAEQWGYGTVRGSSGKGGEAGLLGLVRALDRRGAGAITPDGPRGPAERVKPGAVAAAQHAGAVILPIAARTRQAWWFTSWDRFCLPKPFARVDVVYGPPFTVAEGKEALRAGIERLDGALQAVTYGS
jgi:lysophospholipid acyltransferase (LPLAT)-like uncharacterized protein